MSESKEHRELVSLIIDYAKTLLSVDDYSLMCIDSGDRIGSCLLNYSYIPDLLYCYKGVMIIGEAKTSKDFDRKHSFDQYEAYIDECINFCGKSYLIMAVPWTEMISAKNYLKKIKKNKKTDFKIIVINNYGKKEEV